MVSAFPVPALYGTVVYHNSVPALILSSVERHISRL